MASTTAFPSPRNHRSGRASGFTLIEVMIAFAIFGIAVAWVVEIWTNSQDKAARAINDRELREYAGAFFTKFIYEHNDGSPAEGTLQEYGDWAKLTTAESDRLRHYRYEFSRTQRAPVGVGDSETEPLFASEDAEYEEDGLVDSDSTREVGEGEEGTEKSGPIVWELVLKIYNSSEADPERVGRPIYVLKTYVPPSIPGG